MRSACMEYQTRMTNSPVLQIGLIGLGAVGRLHFEAYRHLQGGGVVAVVDSNPSLLDAVRSSSSVKCYTDVSTCPRMKGSTLPVC